MSSFSLFEQIKALSFEERHQILSLLNEKEPVLVTPNHNYLLYGNIIENPFNLKAYQKPLCPHKELLAPRYLCDKCNTIEQKRLNAIKQEKERIAKEDEILYRVERLKQAPIDLKNDKEWLYTHSNIHQKL